MKVVIEIEDLQTAGATVSYVADRIEEGYRSGIVGCTNLEWYIEKDE